MNEEEKQHTSLMTTTLLMWELILTENRVYVHTRHNSEQILKLKERASNGEQKSTIARDLKISRETLCQYSKKNNN